ncbi:YciI family protein [Nonomuraea sp. SYSU D8015]|uniref:YciI family protein n=1 Tax=Nonomuraea sp. SYSU D8015 TaxID=2593644 RepID=UPI0016609D3A|nr:YciI family protein [Nonomuraea sp. SYSU D8015]
MKYALLLFDPEGYWESVSEAEMKAALEEHAAFARYLSERGIPFSGEAFKPSAEARTLRPADGGVRAADVPFVPLNEELAGFYLVECAGMEEAEEIARHCPTGAGIEIRPVWSVPS